MSTRDLVRTALMAALSAALGYLLAGVPNVELMSASVFTCGALAGVRRGIVVGWLAGSIYVGLNPYGISPPPLFVAQVLGFALIGAGGGVWGSGSRRVAFPIQVLVAGGFGFFLTLVYDVLTNSAIYLMARETTSYAAVVLGGLAFPFPLAHAVGNTIGFALVAPAVCRAAWRWSAE